MNKKPTFYKYKSLHNFEFLLDMILKERLYAAKYNELNDPMEGVIKVDNTVPNNREKEWENLISELRVVCFTKDPDNSLMWAHYADGGKGCLIEFELLDEQEYHKVSYSNKPVLNGSDMNASKAFDMLKYKEKPWKYEAEYRCIQRENRYLPVNIKSITFGPRSDQQSVDMLMHILTLCKPDLKVKKISEIGVFKSPQYTISSGRTFVRSSNSNECNKCASIKMTQRNFVGMYRGWKDY